MTTPRISIVTVVYNRADQLEETILSVLSLTYPNVEYIIIDGGSTDGTIDIIQQHKDQIDYWVSEKDNGIYDAMNKGINIASGDWINFMNCGDRFESINALGFFENSNISADFIYGDAIIEYPSFNTLWKRNPINELWKRPAFCHQAAFARTPLMKEFLFNTKFKLSSDFEFIYRAWRAKKTFEYINRVICIYDLKDGASLQNQLLSLEERKQSVLANEFSFYKWLYFTEIIFYAKITMWIKKRIGKKATSWVTRLLRK